MKTILTAILCAMLPALACGGGAILVDQEITSYISTSIPPNKNEGTISLWVKYTSIYNYNSLIANSAAGGNEWEAWVGVTGSLEFRTNADRSDTDVVTASGQFSVGTWYFIVLRWTTTAGSIYINIVSKGSVSTVGTRSTPENLLLAGGNGNPGLDANIDECLLHNQALSDSEVSAMYASGGAWYPKTGLVSRWSMENNGISTGIHYPDGSTVKDSAGSNDGTVHNNADSSMSLTSSPTRQKRGRR